MDEWFMGWDEWHQYVAERDGCGYQVESIVFILQIDNFLSILVFEVVHCWIQWYVCAL
jgi:hypothetical protein